MSQRSAVPTDVPDFEAAMAELESLVERLERGDLPLEESLQAFERGVALTRTCQAALREAEQKVEVLLKRADGGETREPFDDLDDEDDEA
ncbi:MAG: exodeoxyribonuclease VII small subunit [Steroidobacteraceae bacterium]|nr:exodeoxyribonuclease VII small subunit [Steroidobacteraceae bacterium]